VGRYSRTCLNDDLIEIFEILTGKLVRYLLIERCLITNSRKLESHLDYREFDYTAIGQPLISGLGS
jgi:hypothetical protein